MAGSVNKVILVGNVGADPEIRSFNNGDRVANIRLATSETWKDKQTGEKKERTEWHTVCVLGGLVEIVEKYVSKGSKLYLEGQLQTRKWQDQQGNDRYSTEIVLRPFNGEMVLLSARNDGGGQQGGGYGGPSGNNSGGQARQQPQQTQQQGGGFGGQIDDDIPF